MTHEEFVSGYHRGKIATQVDQSLALRAVQSPLAAKKYRTAHTFWNGVFLLSIVAAIVCFIWVAWWAGLICLFFVFVLPGSIRKSAAGFVVEQALEDSEFFETCLAAGVLRISWGPMETSANATCADTRQRELDDSRSGRS